MFPHKHFTCAIMTNHTIHFGSFAQYKFIIFRLAYHGIALGGELIHGNLPVKEVCNVQIMVEDISG